MRRGGGIYRVSAATGNFRTPTNNLPQIKIFFFNKNQDVDRLALVENKRTACVRVCMSDGEMMLTRSEILIKGYNNLSTINTKQRIRVLTELDPRRFWVQIPWVPGLLGE